MIIFAIAICQIPLIVLMFISYRERQRLTRALLASQPLQKTVKFYDGGTEVTTLSPNRGPVA